MISPIGAQINRKGFVLAESVIGLLILTLGAMAILSAVSQSVMVSKKVRARDIFREAAIPLVLRMDAGMRDDLEGITLSRLDPSFDYLRKIINAQRERFDG